MVELNDPQPAARTQQPGARPQPAAQTQSTAPQPQPAAPQALASAFETNRHYQVHHSYIWLAPIAATFAVTIAVVATNAGNIAQGVQRLQEVTGWGYGLLIALFIALFVVLYGILVAIYAVGYSFLSYEFGASEFSLYSGFITKKHVHVPYARVQSVNHRATIVQRIFGVCSVNIETAGGASNKAVRVPYVTLEVAEQIRTELFTRKTAAEEGIEVVYVARQAAAGGAVGTGAPVPPGQAAAYAGQAPVDAAAATSAAAGATPATGGLPVTGAPVPSGQTVAVGQAPNVLDATLGDVGTWRGAFGGAARGVEEPIAYEHGLTNKELLLTGISHASATTFGLVAGFIGLVGGVIIAFPAFDLDPFLKLGITGTIVIATVIMLVVGWILGVAGVCISFGSFRATRRGSRIEVERGLLQREFSGIDVQRVQSVIIRQSFIRRCMGYCEVGLGRIDASSESSSNSNASKFDRRGLVVHPFVKLDRVDEVLHGLIPEFDDRPISSEMTDLPPVDLRRALLRRCLWYSGSFWTLIVYAVCLAIFATVVSFDPASVGTPDQIAATYALLNPITAIIIAIFVIATALHAISAVLWKRGSGFAYNHGYTSIFNDGLTTELTVVPRTKIQCGYTRNNPFQRHANVTALSVVTAAGTSATTTTLLDVRKAEGAAWLEWLLPRG